jgi:hypothetical protein
MTSTDRPVPRTDESPRLAADARSILACPSSVSMVVEGETRLVGADHELGLTDQHATPTFVCSVDSPVARAADSRRRALLTLTSGLGPRGSAERTDTLTLAGRLERTGTRPGDLLGVRLAGLTPSRVEIQWVDVDGAHRTVVSFPRTAGSLDELGELLRRGLHSGLC